MHERPNYYLDISDETCPMTFVRAKLLIESMASGETAEIRLTGAEPLANVPKSIGELGHEIISMIPEQDQGKTGLHRLHIRKN